MRLSGPAEAADSASLHTQADGSDELHLPSRGVDPDGLRAEPHARTVGEPQLNRPAAPCTYPGCNPACNPDCSPGCSPGCNPDCSPDCTPTYHIVSRWKSLDSVSVFGWCGSAALGGYLADRFGYTFTFLVTAAIQGTATLLQVSQ